MVVMLVGMVGSEGEEVADLVETRESLRVGVDAFVVVYAFDPIYE